LIKRGLACRLLIEEAFMNDELRERMRLKALYLLEYIHSHDTTFSLERILLINELREAVG
jgi:hypothetical protein